MNGDISILLLTAASIGFFHTLLGPDHYLPFIAMSKSGQWSIRKTALVTTACGIGHVLGSIALGLIGIGFGITLSKLEIFESFRGNIASWLLIAFGFAYLLWGIRHAIRNKQHSHVHLHDDGIEHSHQHNHHTEHSHVHSKDQKKNLTPWILFTIFVFGPCEPLIPLLMYPAAKENSLGLIMVTAAFALTTIITMLSIVLISTFSLRMVPLKGLGQYVHAIAGATILLCGVSIQFLGL